MFFSEIIDLTIVEPRAKPLTFHYTGCLIGILMAYYNPQISGYTLNNLGFFHCSSRCFEIRVGDSDTSDTSICSEA